MHLPPPERSAAKRWLVLLVLVLLWQIWSEEPELEPKRVHARLPTCAYMKPYSLSMHEHPVCPASPARRARTHGHSGFEGAHNSYVVALLVAHRLGSD